MEEQPLTPKRHRYPWSYFSKIRPENAGKSILLCIGQSFVKPNCQFHAAGILAVVAQ